MYGQRILTRDKYLAVGNLETHVSGVISESWKRSSLHNVNPFLPSAPKALTNEEIIKMQRTQIIYKALENILPKIESFFNNKYAVTLADEKGTIISLHAHGKLHEHLQSVNFFPGGHWDENICGTNAIGTALASGKSVTINDAEHYCEAWQPFTCAGVPIIHPFTDKVVGVLDLTSFAEDFPYNGLALTATLAKSIENDLFYQNKINSLILEKIYLEHETGVRNDHMFAVDCNGLLIRSSDPYIEIEKRKLVEQIFDWKNFFKQLDQEDFHENQLELPLPFFDETQICRIRPVFNEGSIIGAIIQTNKKSQEQTSFHTIFSKKSKDDHKQEEMLYSHGVIGCSPTWKNLIQKLNKVSNHDVPVLLTGESGTGKEVLAQYIHCLSLRKDKPFIAFNCGALAHDLAASELFGYASGSFTGGLKGGKCGLFESADGGTLFLDEIGEMPLPIQTMLLRVLQEQEVTRIGEYQPRPINVRVIAATNRDLKKEINEGKFRLDLYYRLCVVNFRVPALRERKEDIQLLSNYFLDNKDKGHSRILSSEALQILNQYDWPGNVRELKNAMDYAMLFAEKNIFPEHLPVTIMQFENNRGETICNPNITEEDEKQLLPEKERIIKLLESTRYNISKTAKIMGISRGTLYSRLKQYKINVREDSFETIEK